VFYFIVFFFAIVFFFFFLSSSLPLVPPNALAKIFKSMAAAAIPSTFVYAMIFPEISV